MQTRVFLFYKLKPGIDRAAFERRARDVEARLAADATPITSYALTRLEGALDDDSTAPYDYVEALEVTTLEDYKEVGADPAVKAFLDDWERDVESYRIVHGVVVSRTQP
jgi:hypothetical protein